ncbi:MAG: alpha/beta fold hydrolase [Pseudomonadota bacterium]
MNDNGISWLSEGLEMLIAERASGNLMSADQPDAPLDFDVLIIGSGYGGAIAAEQLAGRAKPDGSPLSLAVLERGKEYLPGTFPSDMSGLAGHVRGSTAFGASGFGQADGLFDLRAGSDINVLVANGLGGGSLINAGVMETPAPEVFDERWPGALQGGQALDDHFESVKQRLGATHNGRPNTIDTHARASRQPLQKTRALQQLGGERYRSAHITVAMQDGANDSGVHMSSCRLCGDCATGCNFGAKESLDVNLLVEARRRGARLITGTTVLRLSREAEQWLVHVVHTDPQLARRQGGPIALRTSKVILAAGSLGSTEILLRSRDSGLATSSLLGQRFSGNGDMLAVGYGQRERVNAVADECRDFDDRYIGPTITGVVDLRGRSQHPMVIEEMAVPGPMRRIFEEIFTTTATLHGLAEADRNDHANGTPARDPLAVDPEAMDHSALYALMGDDGAGGEIRLDRDFNQRDGAVTVHWPGLGENPLFQAQIATLEKALLRVGGKVLPNPLWSPVPAALESQLNARRGALTTVHPLGGCAMADSADQGVVDDLGRVFNSVDGGSVYPDLAVLDGAVLPSAVGTNPALTIAAIAARAVAGLIEAWDLGLQSAPAPMQLTERPIHRNVSARTLHQPTTMQFAERLLGNIVLQTERGQEAFVAELTLFFEDKELRDLYAHSDDAQGHKHTLKVAEHGGPVHKRSRVRLFRKSDWQAIELSMVSGRVKEECLEASAVAIAPLSGRLTILARSGSTRWGRTVSAIVPWFLNRGLRDLWQWLCPTEQERGVSEGARKRGYTPGWMEVVRLQLGSLSHAGEVRRFDYRLSSGVAERDELGLLSQGSQDIVGEKRIRYQRRSNPLVQLSRMFLTDFPSLASTGKEYHLDLVPEFLARKGLPLFRITRQQDAPQALADIVSLAGYFLRLLLNIHLLTFRKPDLSSQREPQRLPAELPGLMRDEPVVVPITHDPEDDSDTEGYIQLTRYRANAAAANPVVLIHGYSASGTTFAHPALEQDLVRHLAHSGRDVWVLDLRSSSGADRTATVNYSFERLGRIDVPVGIERVCLETQLSQVDVVAHCMGAAMFSMAVLEADRIPEDACYRAQRRSLPARINRLVLSQVGPLVSMAPGNVFRAYLFSYLKHQLPLDNYRFTPADGGSLFDELLDRLLCALPYSEADYDRENPLIPWRRTGWVGARHRMDLLYGRTFSLANMSDAALEHIADFFGPLSVDTATQAAHFARFQCITDHGGHNHFVSRAQLRANWRFPTLSIHGADNGLADVSTVGRMKTILEDAGCDYRSRVFPDLGHQDSLIGADVRPVFDEVLDFLEANAETQTAVPDESQALFAQVPWSGPVVGPVQSGAAERLPLSFGVNPALSDPVFVLAIPLQQADTRMQVAGDGRVIGGVMPAPVPVDGWVKVLLPLDRFAGVERLLILLVYDENVDMDNALFGKGSEHIDFIGGQALDWSGAVDDPVVKRVLDTRYEGAWQPLAGAVERCLLEFADSLPAGVVRVCRSPDRDALTLGLGSCQYPPGILDEKPGFRSYRRLASRLNSAEHGERPDLILLMGDQVYVDPTAGLADASDSDERFLLPYQRWFRARAVREVLREVPARMMLDDHELMDNWEPTDRPDEELESARIEGVGHYLNFQRGPDTPGGSSLWYAFEHAGFHFFMADTRTDRQSRLPQNVHERQILSTAQTAALHKWLQDRAADPDPSRPKFLVSASMMLPRKNRALVEGKMPTAIHSDGWEGYPASQLGVLRMIEQLQIENLVMLSGDEHMSCAASVCLQSDNVCRHFWSVHCSALYAPYPFANSDESDLMADEAFTFSGAAGNSVACHVSTEFAPPGDGFGFLEVVREQGRWRISVSFDREEGVSNPVSLQQIQPPCDCAPPVP